MKVHVRVLGLLVGIALFASACTGGSVDVAEPATPAPVETPTEVPATAEPDEPAPTEVPTEVPEPEVTDQDRINAAVAAMDAAIADGTAPNGSIAYDLLDSRVADDGSGNVTLGICEWTGDTVRDTVRDSLWRTSIADDGTITAEHVTTPVAQGDCTNTHMIETALATASAFDAFRTEINADPTLWEDDPRQALLTQNFLEFQAGFVADQLADGLNIVDNRIAGELTETVVEDILWRTVPDEPQDFLEFAVCREMVPERGIYRDGALIDDGKPDNPDDIGPHSIDAFQIVPSPNTDAGWRATGAVSLVWADCLRVESWTSEATAWRSASDSPFEVLER